MVDNAAEVGRVPEPKLKSVFMKPKCHLNRAKVFEDNETKVGVDIPPDIRLGRKYLIKRPFHKDVGQHTSYSHSNCNTDEKEMICTSMKHTEGGWPKDVKTESMEHKSKFIRKTLKEDMFLYTMVKLSMVMEKTLKQNNTIDLAEIYFDDDEPEADVENDRIMAIAKFKDFSGHRRPVSSLAWQKCGRRSSLAVAHCSSDFLGNFGETCTDAYIADFENTTAPKSVFIAPMHLNVIEFNERQPQLLGGGCLNGQVLFLIIFLYYICSA